MRHATQKCSSDEWNAYLHTLILYRLKALLTCRIRNVPLLAPPKKLPTMQIHLQAGIKVAVCVVRLPGQEGGGTSHWVQVGNHHLEHTKMMEVSSASCSCQWNQECQYKGRMEMNRNRRRCISSHHKWGWEDPREDLHHCCVYHCHACSCCLWWILVQQMTWYHKLTRHLHQAAPMKCIHLNWQVVLTITCIEDASPTICKVLAIWKQLIANLFQS